MKWDLQVLNCCKSRFERVDAFYGLALNPKEKIFICEILTVISY